MWVLRKTVRKSSPSQSHQHWDPPLLPCGLIATAFTVARNLGSECDWVSANSFCDYAFHARQTVFVTSIHITRINHRPDVRQEALNNVERAAGILKYESISLVLHWQTSQQ